MVKKVDPRIWATVLISALGYMVDVYDIMIFSVVRVQSLRDLGIAEADLTGVGLSILNWQMVGMLAGGLFWGILGDRKGRMTVLFGSIFMYSAASLLNVFVTNEQQYMLLRFVAGFGLAGELGAGVTLVSEILPTGSRGYGTMIIAIVGVFGATLAGIMGQFAGWKACYLLGGLLGFALLLLRVQVVESEVFKTLQNKNVKRGDLLQILKHPELMTRYLRCLLLAIPAWILMGIFTTLAPELSADMGVEGGLSSAQALLFLNIGIAFGDFASSWLSQKLQSRKMALAIFLGAMVAAILVFKTVKFHHASNFVWLYAAFGTCAGYWALFMTATAEQFGTNLRATATVSAPNFVRAMVVPLTFCLQLLTPEFGLKNSLTILLSVTTAFAIGALWLMKETFSDSMEFTD